MARGLAMVPNAVSPGSDQRPSGTAPVAIPVRPTPGEWFVVARPLVALGAHISAVSWATWLLFTAVPARRVMSHVRCPGPLGSCSPVCSLDALCCVCGVLGHSAPVHLCVRSVCCVAFVVSWATWLLFTGIPARRVVLCVRCPGPLASCSSVCLLSGLCRVCGVPGHLVPVHRCARSVPCVACAVSWASWPLFTCVLAQCVGVLCWVACAVSWATWLLVTGVPGWCVASSVLLPGPGGSCSRVCSLGWLFCVCGVLGHLAPVYQCACSVRCVACTVSLVSLHLFTGLLSPCVVLCVRCPGPLGSC